MARLRIYDEFVGIWKWPWYKSSIISIHNVALKIKSTSGKLNMTNPM
jgi:hypothetical protein